jgi:hypothetical protein
MADRRAQSEQNENRHEAGIHRSCGADGPGIVSAGQQIGSDDGSRGQFRRRVQGRKPEWEQGVAEALEEAYPDRLFFDAGSKERIG